MIGDKIRERRLELGMTQSQIAELTGIKKNTISNYENNVSAPNENNIFKLMEVLKCDANYLFEWDRIEEFQLTVDEKIHIKKYRTLDKYGKEAIDGLLDVEYSRCLEISENNKNLIPSLVAARSKNNDESIHMELLPDLSKFPKNDTDL